MKKAYPYFILVIIISLILSFKFLFFPSDKSKISDNGRNVKKAATPVSVFVVGEASLKDHVYAS
ncbi:MAG: hypothetical protein H7259_06990, partial [Cytophagales bacterium]|nr:hypothetical protein [Cytophaga sp.]